MIPEKLDENVGEIEIHESPAKYTNWVRAVQQIPIGNCSSFWGSAIPKH